MSLDEAEGPKSAAQTLIKSTFSSANVNQFWLQSGGLTPNFRGHFGVQNWTETLVCLVPFLGLVFYASGLGTLLEPKTKPKTGKQLSENWTTFRPPF